MVEELGASIPMEEEVQTLTRLGLTPNQGKVFLTLIHKGNSTVKEISQISGVPREKVYEILSALQEIGLIRKTITAPATFEGIPLSDAISFLIKQKTIEHEDLKLRAASILHNYELSCRNVLQPDQASKLVLVPKKEAVVRHIRNSIENTTSTIDWITSWKGFSKIPMFADELKGAHKRGVRLRIVVQHPKEHQHLQDVIQLIKIPKSQFKTIAFAPQAITCLYDENQVMICTKTETSLMESSVIATNNPSFVELAKSYFEKMWTISQTCE